MFSSFPNDEVIAMTSVSLCVTHGIISLLGIPIKLDLLNIIWLGCYINVAIVIII